jgi:mRNA-degrading endonuclease toxin of MazEF toxin-antitoxin module
VFDVQRIATVASVKLERKLGGLTEPEMNQVLDALAERLSL